MSHRLLPLLASCLLAAAAAAAPAPQFQRFQIGGLSAVALKDGALQEPVDGKSFVVDQPNEAVSAVLTAGGAPGDHFEFSVQPLLVHAGGRVLLFDTGAGGAFGDIAGRLPQSLTAAGESAAAVTDIFITHLHGDHVGGLITASGAPAFPNATIHLSAPEWAALTALTPEGAKIYGLPQVTQLVAAMKPKVAPFQPGAVLLPGVVQAVEFKGHTPGHSGYRIGSGKDTLLVIGDTLHSYVVSVRKPEWHVAFDGDRAVSAATRTALVKRAGGGGERLYAEHFPFPGVGKVVNGPGGATWQPEALH